MFRSLNWLKSYKRNLHRAKQAKYEEGVVGHVNPLTITIHDEQNKYVQRDQVDDENVATPSAYLNATKNVYSFSVLLH